MDNFIRVILISPYFTLSPSSPGLTTPSSPA